VASLARNEAPEARAKAGTANGIYLSKFVSASSTFLLPSSSGVLFIEIRHPRAPALGLNEALSRLAIFHDLRVACDRAYFLSSTSYATFALRHVLVFRLSG
jgi:hypothetical protein